MDAFLSIHTKVERDGAPVLGALGGMNVVGSKNLERVIIIKVGVPDGYFARIRPLRRGKQSQEVSTCTGGSQGSGERLGVVQYLSRERRPVDPLHGRLTLRVDRGGGETVGYQNSLDHTGDIDDVTNNRRSKRSRIYRRQTTSHIRQPRSSKIAAALVEAAATRKALGVTATSGTVVQTRIADLDDNAFVGLFFAALLCNAITGLHARRQTLWAAAIDLTGITGQLDTGAAFPAIGAGAAVLRADAKNAVVADAIIPGFAALPQRVRWLEYGDAAEIANDIGGVARREALTLARRIAARLAAGETLQMRLAGGLHAENLVAIQTAPTLVTAFAAAEAPVTMMVTFVTIIRPAGRADRDTTYLRVAAAVVALAFFIGSATFSEGC